MTSAIIKRLEKELIIALSDHEKAEQEIDLLSRKYRVAVFGPDYVSSKTVEGICSFCANAEKDIEQFVAGVNVLICNECIELCYKTMHESKN